MQTCLEENVTCSFWMMNTSNNDAERQSQYVHVHLAVHNWK